jgi:propanediol dehydratase large subunit
VRNGHVISAVNDPNEYLGPGTGYRLSKERRDKLVAIRDVQDRDEVLRSEGRHAKPESRLIQYRTMGEATVAAMPRKWSSASPPAFA